VSACVWYMSKYASTPTWGKLATRGYLIMRELSRMGHDAVMITSDSNHLNPVPDLGGPTMTEDADGVTTRWIRTRKYKGAQSLGRILSWLDFEWRLWRLDTGDLPRPDLLIVSSLSIFTIFNGLRLRRRYGCRLVFEVRDIWPLTIIEEGGFSPRNPAVMALRWIEKLAYRRADLVVGTMPNLKQHVDESLGERHAPVACIPFGYDADMTEKVRPLPDDWAETHVPTGKFVICHAGTIGVTNALDVLFNCARSMQDHANVHFLIVGEGYLRARYQAECADLTNVTFTGPVAKDQVQAVLKHCDVTYFSVQPSKVWTYGLSLNKIVDYMVAGKPILSSYTGYPTMIDEARAGVSSPAGDAFALKGEILRLAAMPARERDAMGRRGRDWLLSKRSYRTLAQDYLDVALPDRAAA
jgi:glycosyltransferase involved in cell wall biosynthesis